ncbi:MAG TPA: hypothetical protein VEW47_00705 [Candidatus Dormibacteraeota bacterium]|nr:hypothetical protein [Candidatus Dormibacteraeota bacterium]
MDLTVPPPAEEVTLDLTDLAFIDPVGLVSLWAWKNRVQATCRGFTLTRPRSADVQKYLDVMDFFNPTPQNTGSQISWGSSGIYFPVHHLREPGVGVVENLASELATTFGDHVPGTTSALAYCFQEAMDNVFQHAESPVGAVAAAQLFPHTPRRWCQASIADMGVGVLRSLRRSPEHADLPSDEQALRLAIQRNVTSTAPYVGMYGGSRPGMGLYMISEVCRRTGGELMLLSGDTLLRVERGGETVENLPRWNGTILTVRLSANVLDNAGDVISEIRRSLRGPVPEGLAQFED